MFSKDDILKIIQSDEPTIIQKYLEDCVILIHNKIEQYTTELMTLSSSYPLTLPPLELIDKRLKEFVRLHHIDLIRTINYQINKFKDQIHEKQLFQHFSSYHLGTEQVLIGS